LVSALAQTTGAALAQFLLYRWTMPYRMILACILASTSAACSAGAIDGASGRGRPYMLTENALTFNGLLATVL
jgi:hypothetical protein